MTHFMMLPRVMRQVFRPSKLTLASARDSWGMWISTSDASGTTRGLHHSACLGGGCIAGACQCQAYQDLEMSMSDPSGTTRDLHPPLLRVGLHFWGLSATTLVA